MIQHSPIFSSEMQPWDFKTTSSMFCQKCHNQSRLAGTAENRKLWQRELLLRAKSWGKGVMQSLMAGGFTPVVQEFCVCLLNQKQPHVFNLCFSSSMTMGESALDFECSHVWVPLEMCTLVLALLVTGFVVLR